MKRALIVSLLLAFCFASLSLGKPAVAAPEAAPAAESSYVVPQSMALSGQKVDLRLEVLAPGQMIEGVRLDNLGGQISLWRSDGRESRALPIAVRQGGAQLTDGSALMRLGPSDEKQILELSLDDNGAFRGGRTDFRVTVFLAGGERLFCLLNPADFLNRAPAANQPPEAAPSVAPSLSTDDRSMVRAIGDAVHLAYFTPSPFYTQDEESEFGRVVSERENEALALAEELISRAAVVESQYSELCEAFVAVIDGVTASVESSYAYSAFVGHIERDMYALPFNLNGYAKTFADWKSAASGTSFRSAQARHFQMLTAMAAGYEACDGIERIAVQAGAFLKLYPDADGAEELARAIEAAQGLSGELSEIGGMSATLAKMTHNVMKANNALALAVLNEKIRATKESIESGNAPEDAEARLMADTMFKDRIDRANAENALPEQASGENAALVLQETAESIMGSYVPAIGAAYEIFWDTTLEEAVLLQLKPRAKRGRAE